MEKRNYIKHVNIYKKQMPYWLNIVCKTLFALFVICLICVAIFNFIYTCVPVIGASMYPTLSTNGDSVYINRYSTATYEDIIVIYRENENKYVVKRLYAVEGDKIALIRGKDNEFNKICVIKSDGTTQIFQAQSQMLVGDNTYTKFQKLKQDNIWGKYISTIDGVNYLTIPEKYVFYLGDNWNSSNDCANYGPVPKDKVVGRVDIIIPESKNHFTYVVKYFVKKLFT